MLEAYPVRIAIPLAWGEMDAFGHVNNTVYFRYFESVRIACFDQLDLLGELSNSGCGPILAQTSCRFKIPLHYPDQLTAATRITDLQTDRFRMEYAVYSERAGAIAAEGDGQIVWYDYQAKRKTAMHDTLRERIHALHPA